VKRHFSSIVSDIFGKFAQKEFTPKVQNFINSAYVKLMGLDMSRFDDASSYSSLKNLFIRPLKKDVAIDAKITSVISPCDSKIIAFGKIKSHTAYQIKGMSYDTNKLIGAQENSAILDGGEYINFYLSPKDYHRYHMPFDVRVLSALHIPGKLYPVNMPLLKNKKNLYLENERVVLEVLDKFDKKHFIILVGALNVGKMVVTFEDAIKTNSDQKEHRYTYSEPKVLKKGEMFGWFEMGSTIVILSQKDAIKYSVELGSSVKYGDVIGELCDN
jgi:phosphatidylserine decarboxylase